MYLIMVFLSSLFRQGRARRTMAALRTPSCLISTCPLPLQPRSWTLWQQSLHDASPACTKSTWSAVLVCLWSSSITASLICRGTSPLTTGQSMIRMMIRISLIVCGIKKSSDVVRNVVFILFSEKNYCTVSFSPLLYPSLD